MKFVYATLLALVISQSSFAQIPGGYSVSLEALEIPGGVGLHSYAFGTANGKWLVAGAMVCMLDSHSMHFPRA
jgi:hypothetical protein